MSTQNRGHLIRVTKASFDTISHLAVIEQCAKAEIVRRALDAYGNTDTSKPPVVVAATVDHPAIMRSGKRLVAGSKAQGSSPRPSFWDSRSPASKPK